MRRRYCRIVLGALTCAAALTAAATAGAEKPTSPPGLSKRGGPPPSASPSGPTVTFAISPRDQHTIRQYYGRQFTSGHCPPGLAKKNNGCLPPGQAKKWSQGQPLPGGVPYYGLPADLLRQLVPPPVGYQYIRVADDVLLMATGTRMIIDAVRDLALP